MRQTRNLGQRWTLGQIGCLEEMENTPMLWTILVTLVVMWPDGLGFGVPGSLIHLLLIIVFLILIINLLQGRRAGL
jgi:hypothetical protein